MDTRFIVDEIPDGGHELEGPLEEEWFAPLLFDQYHAENSSVSLKGRLYKAGKNVILEATLTAKLSFDCSRCAEEATIELQQKFIRVYWAQGKHLMTLDLDVEDIEDIDGGDIIGNVVDIEPALAEEFVLMMPGYPLCKPDCKGLCPICGHNLNEGDCGCDRNSFFGRDLKVKIKMV